MQTKTALVEQCTDILRKETDLLSRLSLAQEKVRRAVFSREWPGLETQISDLDAYAQEFSRLEAERARLFAKLGGETETVGFYTMAAHLPSPERRELTELYRRLKMDTLQVRLANDALSHYLTEAKATVSGFLEAAFPDRKGRIYSRRGRAVHSEMRSLVLDHCL